MRKRTKEIKIGNVVIGNNNPIIIQSMTNTDTRDVEATVKQIVALTDEGCQIVRCAVPDMEAAEALKGIVERVEIPVVADIHFDYMLAIRSMENGVSKVRINPGNIGSVDKVKAVVQVAKERGIPIRIGVNSGSVEKSLLEKYGSATVEAMVESALNHVKILEGLEFYDTVISVKGSNVPDTIECCRQLSEKVDYPLHIGITESGTVWRGSIKSAVGIGTILHDGIGDTIRVSLTGDPVEEIKVCKEILKSLSLLKSGIEFVSCPTCGRTQVDLIKIANEVEEKLKNVNKNIKVAMMGCAVNGPGEARAADIGIAAGNGVGLIFKKGEIIKKVPEENLVEELIAEINQL